MSSGTYQEDLREVLVRRNALAQMRRIAAVESRDAAKHPRNARKRLLEWDEVGRLRHVGQRSDGLVANGSERARASRHGHPAESLLVVPRVEAV